MLQRTWDVCVLQHTWALVKSDISCSEKVRKNSNTRQQLIWNCCDCSGNSGKLVRGKSKLREEGGGGEEGGGEEGGGGEGEGGEGGVSSAAAASVSDMQLQ